MIKNTKEYILVLVFFSFALPLMANRQYSPHSVQASVWVNTELLAPAYERDIWWIADKYSHEFIENLSAEERVQFFSILSLFDELRWILSGMIYGFWFEYIPASREYGVKEEFLLQHIALIDVGDPNMRLVSVAKTGGWLELTVQYELSMLQKQRITLQSNSGLHHARGRAYGFANFGFESRKITLENSIKDAIHQKLRILYKSRPQQIMGEVYLRNPSSIELVNGQWQAKSDIAMSIKKVEF